MTLVLGFVPFILFSLVARVSDDLALWIAFAASFALGMRAFLETRVLKTLDAAGTLLFGSLALYKGFVQPGLASGAVQLVVHAGLLAVMVVSLFLHEPFTLQYSREQVLPESWKTKSFLRANNRLTAIWVLALAVMAAIDAAALLTPDVSYTLAATAALVALAGALTFTVRYPVTARESGGPD